MASLDDMDKYIVVTAPNLVTLCDLVNAYMDYGYKPHARPFLEHNAYWYQAIVKNECD